MTAPDVPPNLRHPGWPDYVGPPGGWALLGHHDILVEYWPNFAEHVQDIRGEKSVSQHASRFRHFVVLAEEEVPLEFRQAWEAWKMARDKAWEARNKAWEARNKAWVVWDKAWEAWKMARAVAQPALEALLAHYVPDHRWNGTEIVFETEG